MAKPRAMKFGTITRGGERVTSGHQRHQHTHNLWDSLQTETVRPTATKFATFTRGGEVGF